MTEIQFRSLPPITQEQLKAYSVAAADPNEIHLNEAVAKKSGLPGVIAHGMLSMAFVAERALQHAREYAPGLKLVSVQSRFKAMTFLGDVISVGGVVKEQAPSVLVLDLQCRNQKGEVTTLGSARFESVCRSSG